MRVVTLGVGSVDVDAVDAMSAAVAMRDADAAVTALSRIDVNELLSRPALADEAIALIGTHPALGRTDDRDSAWDGATVRERWLLLRILIARAKSDLFVAGELAARLREARRVEGRVAATGSSVLAPFHLGVTALLTGDTATALADLTAARRALSRFDRPVELCLVDGLIAVTSALRGALDAARDHLATVTEVAAEETARAAAGDPRIALTAVLSARLIAMETVVADPLADGCRADDSELWPIELLASALRELSQGSPAGALELTQVAELVHGIPPFTLASDIITALRVECLLRCGHTLAARALLDEHASGGMYTSLAEIRTLIYEENLPRAARRCRELGSLRDLSLAHRGELLGLRIWIDCLADGHVAAADAAVFSRIATRSGLRRVFTTVPDTVIAAVMAALPQAEAGELSLALADLGFLPAPPRQPRLSPKERGVLSAIQVHRTIPATAAALFVSPNTVKTQLSSVYRKLGATNRVEAIAAAERLGLFDLDDKTA